MIYRIFKNGTNEQIDEVRDVNWPLIKKDDQFGVNINGRETLCKVVEVAKPSISPDNRLIVDIWVIDLFPRSN